jgi:hypothetical protein
MSSHESSAQHFTVRVSAEGLASVFAATKAEAERRARDGDFDRVRMPRPVALISTLRKVE